MATARSRCSRICFRVGKENSSFLPYSALPLPVSSLRSRFRPQTLRRILLRIRLSSHIFISCITESSLRLFLITALGAIFLRGFKEAIGIAVFLVAIYLALNLTVIAVGFYEIATHATVFWDWKHCCSAIAQQSVSDDRNGSRRLSQSSRLACQGLKPVWS